MENSPRKEGHATKAIENQTARIPSDACLFAVLGSMAVSLTLKYIGQNIPHYNDADDAGKE